MKKQANSGWEGIAAGCVACAERRRARRSRIPKAVRICPADMKFSEEVRSTLNESRDGIYFATWSKHYHVGMPLVVTFLDDSPHTSCSDYRAEVLRVDSLGGSRLGIAARFLWQ
jgi:hypothetical protein